MRYIIFAIVFFSFNEAFAQDTYLYKAQISSNGNIIDVFNQPNSSTILFKIADNQGVYILFEKEAWVKIETRRGTKGWIEKKFIKKLPDDHLFPEEQYIKIKRQEIQRIVEKQLPPRRHAFQLGVRGYWYQSGLRMVDEGDQPVGFSFGGGGIGVLYNINRFNSIEIDAMFWKIGGNFKTEDEIESEFRYTGISIPLMYYYRNRKFFLGLGGYYSNFFEKSYKINHEYITEDGYEMTDFDYGPVFSLGFVRGSHFIFEARVYSGVNNILTVGINKYNNMNIELAISYYF